MSLPFLYLTWEERDFATFIDFWWKFYESYRTTEESYNTIIPKNKFTKEDIRVLFNWKNGMKIAGHKKKTIAVAKVLRQLKLVNQLKEKFDQAVFDQAFHTISPIWQIFLLHIIKPSEYPIFDQHVYRAHIFITEHIIREIPRYRKKKLAYYQDIYCPFIRSVVGNGLSPRKIDNAMWQFGKVLKTVYAGKLSA